MMFRPRITESTAYLVREIGGALEGGRDMTKPFEVQIPGLKSQPTEIAPTDEAKVCGAAERVGFLDREPRKRRGRPPSPRTGQVHAHVLPEVHEEVLAESRRRGVQQGVLIEEAWSPYEELNGLR